jgi:hypothetical protein
MLCSAMVPTALRLGSSYIRHVAPARNVETRLGNQRRLSVSAVSFT